MRLPPLGAFRVFDIAAHTESFVKAAQTLHVTHGAVSRQIRQLEETLGVALFERRNRAVFLTPAGRTLQLTTSAIFEQLEGTVHRLRQHSQENTLVLSCEPTIAMKWLIPRLPSFQEAHPDIQLHLSAAGGPIDFQKAGVDLALRRNDFNWDASVHAFPICDEWVGPVSKPVLNAASGSESATGPESAPTSERGSGLDAPWLLDGTQMLLHTKSRPNAWRHWSAVSGIAVHGSNLEYEHFYLCIQAAVAGLGMAISSFFMVQEELASKHLVAPHGFVRDGSGYCLLSARAVQDDPKCWRFAQWVTQEMAKCTARVMEYTR